MLHLLRRDGRRPQERFVTLAYVQGPRNGRREVLLEEAVRELGEAGKVRRLKHRETGRVYLEATEGLDVPSYERALGRIVRSERHRIHSSGAVTGCPDKPRSASMAVPGESSA